MKVHILVLFNGKQTKKQVFPPIPEGDGSESNQAWWSSLLPIKVFQMGKKEINTQLAMFQLCATRCFKGISSFHPWEYPVNITSSFYRW